MNEIIPYLHLGGVDVYNDNEFFKTHQVDLIINCTREFETPPARRCILTVQFGVLDIGSMEKTKHERDASIMLDTLPALVDLIHAHVKHGQAHSCALSTRPATLPHRSCGIHQKTSK